MGNKISLDISPTNPVSNTTWSPYEYGRCLTKLYLVFLAGPTTIDGIDFESCTHNPEYLLNLQSQFSGRHNDQSLDFTQFEFH